MGRGRRRQREAPHVRPVDVDGLRTVSILTVLWAVAFVALALNRQRLEEAGTGWLLWTCLAGVGLGLLGIEYTRKRRDTIALARLEEEEAADEVEPAEDEPDDDEPDDDERDEEPGDASKDDHPQSGGPEVGEQGVGGSEDRRPAGGLADGDLKDDTPGQGQTRSAPGTHGAAGRRQDTIPTRPVPQATPRPAQPPWSSPTTAPASNPTPRPASSRRRPSRGPDRPGRVDVADIADAGPQPPDPTPTPAQDSSPHRHGTSADDTETGSRSADQQPSPIWSELLDTSGTGQTPPVPDDDPDGPLLDDTTLGRRAKRYNEDGEIDEITDGAGTQYRGRRARRRPNSA